MTAGDDARAGKDTGVAESAARAGQADRNSRKSRGQNHEGGGCDPFHSLLLHQPGETDDRQLPVLWSRNYLFPDLDPTFQVISNPITDPT